METRPKTIFLDIDGTLVEHSENINQQLSKTPKLLHGTLEKLAEWDKKGYNIILTTGRKESHREITIKQLTELGIFFDQLIMGLGGGVRVLINDKKLNKDYDTAISFNLKRNEGISNIEI
jgi:hydroxymethylpyrimidine pyrophosphatase-like HAD family hydrolase